MYPDNAYYEFYPAEIVDKILRENPGATVEELNCLMQAEYDAVKPRHQEISELADELGFSNTKPIVRSMAEMADELGL